MDVAWFAPVVVVVVGAVGSLVLARLLVVAVRDLQGAQRRFGRLEQSLIPLRVETRRTRTSIEHLRRR